MITKAFIHRGMGDALNSRDFLISYCNQKQIEQSAITVYTDLHKQIFEDTNFIIKDIKDCDMKGLYYYANFGDFDLLKIYNCRKYDDCISVNAQISYTFNTIYPINWKADISDINLPKRFITINYGHDNNSDKNLKCLKMWLLEYWEELVAKIGIDCVQIGGGWTCKNIKGIKLNLVNKLSLKQSAEVMKRALFHIDIEGGLVILARHIGVKSVVLFTNTDKEHFSREGNLNLRNTKCIACSGSLNHKRKNSVLYAKKFPCKVLKKEDINRCAKELTPDFVISKIKEANWL